MSEHTEAPKLSGRFSKALVYAELKHHNQVRKGGAIPYVGHLLSVASLVINDGGSEEQAIAALLLWNYESLLSAYREHGLDSWMVDELGRVVAELKRLVEGGDRAVVV